MTTLRNFVDGKFAPARDGRTSEVVDPSTGEAYCGHRSPARRTSTPPCRPRREAFETWRDSTPAERSLALLRFADAIEARPTTWSRPRPATPASRSP